MINRMALLTTFIISDNQGITGLDCWIVQSRLQSSLADWIVIDNPKLKLDFGFGLSIQYFSFQSKSTKSEFSIGNLIF